MASPASVAKHPIHPMLVVFPIGLWVFSLVADVIHAFGGAPVWRDVAFYTMAGGIVGALLAAIPGFVDYLALRDPRARRLAQIHMVMNLAIVALFVVDLWLRTWMGPESRIPLALSVIGVVLLGISGWLGGEMVYVLGVGVDAERPPARGKDRARAA
jgi:uncharacterized membrane protein